MTDLGLLHYFLGLQVHQSSHGIFIYQEKYALDLLQRFGMVDCKTSPTPFQSGFTLTTSESFSISAIGWKSTLFNSYQT
jgi:hypothetical protein